MTATLVWQFRNTPDRYTSYMGNARPRTLKNGKAELDNSANEIPESWSGRPSINHQPLQIPSQHDPGDSRLWEKRAEGRYLNERCFWIA